MSTSNILGLTGLVISIFGTALIWWDSQKAIGKISGLLKVVASKIGYWVDDPLPETELAEFDKTIQKASKLDIRGFCLLILGFILQLLSIFEFCL